MKAAGAFEGRPRELRTRHNMRAIYCKNRNGATQQTFIFRTASPLGLPPIRGYAVVRAGAARLQTPPPGPFLLAGVEKTEDGVGVVRKAASIRANYRYSFLLLFHVSDNRLCFLSSLNSICKKSQQIGCTP